MMHPQEDHSLFRCDVIDEIVAEVKKESMHQLKEVSDSTEEEEVKSPPFLNSGSKEPHQ
ncbi:hypothetical protein PIB30_115234, partial [Stylosanthes scabra]|nr:hypothetical protein [Stylosanthes scabra]